MDHFKTMYYIPIMMGIFLFMPYNIGYKLITNKKVKDIEKELSKISFTTQLLIGVLCLLLFII